MKITRTSCMTNVTHSLEMDVTEEQIAAWKADGRMIQDYFPQLTPDEREFILSGITPEEWYRAFPDD